MSITERQHKVLCEVINIYIETAEPVGSKVLQAKCFSQFSPATIRNDLFALEEEGYLMQTHISSGRVPTEKGYVLYIDKLMKVYAMTRKEKSLIDDLSRSLQNDMEHLIDKTLLTMNAMLNNISVVQSNRLHSGLKIKGLNKIIKEPEFEVRERLQNILEVVDNSDKLTEVFKDNHCDQVKVKIGSSVGLKELEDCAVVTKNITCKDDSVISLGVIGPMRMRYARAISVLDMISKIVYHSLENMSCN